MISQGLGGGGLVTQGLGDDINYDGIATPVFVDVSPAEVLRAALVDAAVVVLRSENQTGNWPAYVGHIPDEPDNAVCIYDTSGLREGRSQRTGASVDKPGWQVRVRGKTYREAIVKIQEISSYIDLIFRQIVTIEDTSFIIEAVNKTSTVLSLGQELEGERRDTFTLNGTITFEQTS